MAILIKSITKIIVFVDSIYKNKSYSNLHKILIVLCNIEKYTLDSNTL